MTIERNDSNDTHVFPGQDGNVPLQVTRWTGQRESVTTSGASQRLTLPTGTGLVEITAEQNVYLNFGDNTVVASAVIADDASRFFLLGVQVIPVPIDPATELPYTHVAVIQQNIAGVFQVEQLN